MQIETQSFQLPQYQSALLKKQRQSKVLSPKVTHIYPQIKQIQKLKLKKHHLDDTQMKLALQYDYQDNQQPKQYLFRGDKINYDKNDYNIKHNNRNLNKFSNTGFTQQTNPNQLKLNTQYFQSQPNFNHFTKPQRDITNQTNQTQKPFQRNYQTQNNEQTRLKKSISVTDFETLKRQQYETEQKMMNKINNLQNQTQRLNKNMQIRQKSGYNEPIIGRYKSQTKKSSVQKDYNKLKQKLQRQRTKQKQRLQNELNKIKQQTKRIKEEQRKRKRSFKQLLQKQQGNKYLDNLITTQNRVPINSLRSITCDMNNMIVRQGSQQENMIGQRLNELQRKYMPKTNIVNKRIQCQIYDPVNDHLRRINQKPAFVYNDQSQTDSEFSDY